MKIKILLFTLLFPYVGYAQSSHLKMDSLYENVKNIHELLIDSKICKSFHNRYKMYPTENIYTFLKLDTGTGIIKQVQWNLDKDKEFSVSINDIDLTYGFSYKNETERFELYPTQNMYQFLLLDKCNGLMWHVQWGMKEENRWIRFIN